MTDEEKVVDPEARLSLFLSIPSAIVAIILKGWVIVMMWDWFVVPAFGSEPLTIPYAVGLIFLIGYLVKDVGADEVEEKAKWPAARQIKSIKWSFSAPLLVVSIGWIIHLFV